MRVNGYYDGAEKSTYTNKAGEKAVCFDVLFRSVGEDGEPDMRQNSFRTFDDTTIAKIPELKRGEIYEFELKVKEASVTAIY